MGEVIPFPGKHKDYPVQSVKDIEDQVLQNRMDNISNMMKPFVGNLIGLIGSLNVDMHENGKNIAYIVEATRALLFKINGLEHDFQTFIDEKGKIGYDEDGDPQYYFGQLPKNLTDMNPNPPPNLTA